MTDTEMTCLDSLGQVMRKGDRVTAWWDGEEYTGVIDSFTSARFLSLDEVGMTIRRDSDGALVESTAGMVTRDDSDMVPPGVLKREAREGEPVSKWHEGQRVRVVECNDSTRQPVQGGKAYDAEVLSMAGPYVIAHIPELDQAATFWVQSGWTAWDAMFRWRLMPLPEGGGDDGEPQPQR